MTRNGKLTPERRRRYWRITLASVVLMVVGAMALPLTGYLYVGLEEAYAQAGADDANPRANYWRAVRSGQPGSGAGGDSYSSVTGRPMPGSDAAWLNRETDNLINNSAQNWRQIRNRVIAVWGAGSCSDSSSSCSTSTRFGAASSWRTAGGREGPALDGVGAVRALDDRGVVHRSRGNRPQPAVRQVGADSDHGSGGIRGVGGVLDGPARVRRPLDIHTWGRIDALHVG